MDVKASVHPNTVEFQVFGPYALFSDPIMRVGGEKISYPTPTYEALKGVLSSVYWKPTITWVIDAVRVMNPIRMESKGVSKLRYEVDAKDLSINTYLRDCCYQVRAHFEFNMNRHECEKDRDRLKHLNIAQRMIKLGGRRDVFLGTRECQAYVTPCTFGEGAGAYDNQGTVFLGAMYHGMTYPDEAYDSKTRGHLTVRFWQPTMENGIIEFLRPEQCPVHRVIREMQAKIFPPKKEAKDKEEEAS